MDHPRIQSDPKVMMGKPVIRGTRITVEHILRCLAAGDNVDQLLSDHPRLTAEDIRAHRPSPPTISLTSPHFRRSDRFGAGSSTLCLISKCTPFMAPDERFFCFVARSCAS
jgi:uncharacterized protein (DUF433 family)